jgi:hypothetical protein
MSRVAPLARASSASSIGMELAGADAGSGTIPFARANCARPKEPKANPQHVLGPYLHEHRGIEIFGPDLHSVGIPFMGPRTPPVNLCPQLGHALG